MQPATSPAASDACAIARSPDWRTAVTDLLDYWVSQGKCFSSGEVAATIRTHRIDLKFRVSSIGEQIRDLAQMSSLPCYDDGNGDGIDPVRSDRIADGSGRTPSGTLVFVYGPRYEDAQDHEFEVDIPSPGKVQDGTRTGAPTATGGPLTPSTPIPTGGPLSPTPAPTPAPKATVKKVRGVNPATGYPDPYVGACTRLFVPRAVIDDFRKKSGFTGNVLHVEIAGDEVIITATGTARTQARTIWKGHGQIGFYRKGDPFIPGKRFPVQSVTDEAVILELY